MSGGHSSSGIGDAIKKGVGMVHGTGEAIRGNFNAAVDQAGGDRVGVDKNAAIATKGADEIEHGYHRTGHGAGVTPVDADRERLNTTQTTSTNYGSHSTNTANKLDPRFDSDMDHRGTATGSTNVGHHSNNVANKLDPRIDSDADHRANPSSCCTQAPYSQTDGTNNPTALFGSKWEPPSTSGQDHEHDEHCNCHALHIHRGSISGGTNLEAAQKLDPILDNEDGLTNIGPHSTNIAKKLDPRVDSDADYRGNVTVTKPESPDQSDGTQCTRMNGPTRAGTFTRRGTEPSRPCEPRGAPRSTSDDNVHHGTSSKDSTAPLDEPPPTTHKSEFLNLLDLRVNRGGSKQMRSSGSAGTPDGEYLIRAEHIGVHGTHDQAEFYYSCAQVKVTNGTGTTLPTDTIKFPGGHKKDDLSFSFSIYGGFKENHMPGPAVWDSTSTGGSAPSNSTSGSFVPSTESKSFVVAHNDSNYESKKFTRHRHARAFRQ